LLSAADKSIQQKKQEMDEEDLEDEEVQEDFLLQRLDAGLFILQLVDLAIAFVCANSPDTRIKSQFLDLLSMRGRDVKEIIDTLQGSFASYSS
jgi:beta-catenin-like protein 1